MRRPERNNPSGHKFSDTPIVSIKNQSKYLAKSYHAFNYQQQILNLICLEDATVTYAVLPQELLIVKAPQLVVVTKSPQ